MAVTNTSAQNLLALLLPWLRTDALMCVSNFTEPPVNNAHHQKDPINHVHIVSTTAMQYCIGQSGWHAMANALNVQFGQI